MADQLEGKALSDAVAVALGWTPPNGPSDTVSGHYWRSPDDRQPDRACARAEGGGWWADVPDYLDPSTDEVKLRWLSDRLRESVTIRVGVDRATAYVGDWAGRSFYFRGEGRTLSEALCRLILAVKEAGRG